MNHFPTPTSAAQVTGPMSVSQLQDLDDEPFTLLAYGDWSLPMNCHPTVAIQAELAIQPVDSAGAAIKNIVSRFADPVEGRKHWSWLY